MALDCFMGKWQEERKDGFDAFAAALGLSPEKTAFFREAKTIISYNRDGDVWIIDVAMSNDNNSSNGRQFRFKMGEPYQSANLDGTPMESVITAQGGTFVETHKMPEMGEMQITRQVQDSGTMLVTTAFKDKVMTSIYVRC